MARTPESKELVNRLIAETTGFQKNEENFGICRQYVNSYLRFHRYLDVDSHKVSKMLEGLYEKFTVHSETLAGDTLKQKVLQFLESPSFERKDTVKTDTHYAILSFLLEMSNSPSIDPHIPAAKTEEGKTFDDVDWYKYLTEDLEPLQSKFSDSESDSEESETELTTVTICGAEVSDETIAERIEATTDDLRHMLVSRYWAGELDVQLHGETDLAHNWTGHMNAVGSVEHSNQDSYMSEYQMVREVLWMLAGTEQTFLFSWDDVSDSFTVRNDTGLTHITKPSLVSTLKPFIQLATGLSQLRHFTSLVSKGGYQGLQSRTYQAFSVACLEVISEIDRFSCSLTKDINTDAATATLISLYAKYREYGEIIEVLHSIYSDAVLPFVTAEKPAVSLAASSLLLTCNKAVNNASMICSRVLLRIVKVFVVTLEPYLSIIDEWLTKGNLNDPHSEFVIQKKDSECLDETFWDTAIVEMTAVGDAVSPTDVYSFSSSVPGLLRGTLSNITIAGKSMEMLSQLGKLSLAIGKQEQSLHQRFAGQFCRELCESVDDIYNDSCTEVASAAVEETIVKLQSYTDMNPMLLSNLRALFHQDCFTDVTKNLSSIADEDLCKMSNISKVMSHSLEVQISERHRRVSDCLLHVLYRDCKLQHYLAMIRRVYLLEAGYVMSEFCWPLFDKIRHQEHWKDSLSLNVSFQECLERGFPADASRFSITLTGLFRSELLPIHTVEELNLHYMVDWPIDVIYSSECEQDYNRIFTFLLQIKLSKYCLDNLKFCDLDRQHTEDKEALSHAEQTDLKQDVYLLRMRLLHFVNGLQEYIMTMILHSSSSELQRQLSGAEDMEAVIKTHRAYLNIIYNRCFLHETNKIIRDCLLRLLNSALVFQRLWDAGLTLTTKSKLQEISAEFNQHLQNLGSFVLPLIKTGSVPHCK